ncbi:phosphoribosyltransferase family protein [Empedobacter falsenii]
MKNRYSLHKIINEVNFSFEPTEYSLFKYGHTGIAEKFAKELFQGFIIEFETLIISSKEILIFPSPYMSIPTASNYLAKFFKIELDKYLYNNGLKSSKMSKINRSQTYTIDYGNLSFEERKNLISNDTYYLETNILEGKTCIFLDDIKITGSHEYTVDKIIEGKSSNSNILYVYYAELINKSINPKIENFFNYFEINSIESLLEILKNENFRFNTRVIKHILKLNEIDFKRVLEILIRINQYDTFFNLSISNDYHLINEYKHNLNIIKNGNKLTKRTKTEY